MVKSMMWLSIAKGYGRVMLVWMSPKAPGDVTVEVPMKASADRMRCRLGEVKMTRI